MTRQIDLQSSILLSLLYAATSIFAAAWRRGFSTLLDTYLVANVYFTSDVDAKSRISSLNEFSNINLNEIRRAGAHDDGGFNESKISDQEFDDEIASTYQFERQ